MSGTSHADLVQRIETLERKVFALQSELAFQRDRSSSQ
jgi:hypothetical protein